MRGCAPNLLLCLFSCASCSRVSVEPRAAKSMGEGLVLDGSFASFNQSTAGGKGEVWQEWSSKVRTWYGEDVDMTTLYINWLISASVYLLLTFLVAYLYKTYVMTKRLEEFTLNLEHKNGEEPEFFTSPLFGCFEDPKICIWSFCCPAIRWADTMNLGLYMSFWTAIAIFFGCDMLCYLCGCVIPLAILGVVKRQQLRAKFNMQSGDCESICFDTLSWVFCACCAVAQEARHVEEAWASGHPAVDPAKADA